MNYTRDEVRNHRGRSMAGSFARCELKFKFAVELSFSNKRDIPYAVCDIFQKNSRVLLTFHFFSYCSFENIFTFVQSYPQSEPCISYRVVRSRSIRSTIMPRIRWSRRIEEDRGRRNKSSDIPKRGLTGVAHGTRKDFFLALF